MGLQVRVAASLHLMGLLLSRWALRIHAFLSGFLFSSLLSLLSGCQYSALWVQKLIQLQDVNGVRSHPRLLASVEEEYSSIPHGETGESSIDLIPFQVIDVLNCFLFWNLKFEEVAGHTSGGLFCTSDGPCLSGFVS